MIIPRISVAHPVDCAILFGAAGLSEVWNGLVPHRTARGDIGIAPLRSGLDVDVICIRAGLLLLGKKRIHFLPRFSHSRCRHSQVVPA
jgi:hypothetical protein